MSRKRFFINGTALAQKHSGVQNFMINVLRELDDVLEKYRDYDVEILYPCTRRLNIDELNFRNIRIRKIFCRERDLYNWFFTIYSIVHRSCFLGMCNDRPVRKNSIIVLHDLIIYHRPECVRKITSKICAKAYARMNNASKILTISETTKQDICRSLNIDKDKIKVIYCGYEHIKNIKPDYSLLANLNIMRNEYVYTVGNLIPHKNFQWVYENAKSHSDITFVVAGNMTKTGNLKWFDLPNIKYLGYVTNEQNVALMKECKLFVFPSLMEGFGLPPLEALACGARVAVSNASCLPEIYGNCVAYFDPHDYNVDFDELLKFKPNPPDDLFKIYSWKRVSGSIFEEMQKVYE